MKVLDTQPQAFPTNDGPIPVVSFLKYHLINKAFHFTIINKFMSSKNPLRVINSKALGTRFIEICCKF